MLNTKQLKQKYRQIFQLNFEKYYPVDFIKSKGFSRNKCKFCSKYFWNINKNRNFCGDSTCEGGYSFIGNSPAKNKLTYTEVWETFSSRMKKQGYVSIKRYPTNALWRDDIYFVEASIDDFIPFVVSGEVKPPANPLVVPQLCLRFNDIDNIGITGAHYALFSMIGQHAFVTPKEYNMNLYLENLFYWFENDLGLLSKDITLHEDVWAGSNKFGPCIEIFSRGLELANQVYMQFEQTESGYKDLNIKVLDMGMGQERISWFSQGSPLSYDTTFPKVMKTLYEISGLKTDEKLMAKFIPYAGYLNVDEVEDLDKAWKEVANNVGIDVEELKKKILPLSALYSIAEHTRALLVALNDGGLPSNVGGGYNLRILARRCFDFIEKYSWNIDLFTICKEHAKELKQQYPELSENLDEVKKILDVEKSKYNANKQKAKAIVDKLIKDKEKIDTNKLIELYDSNGINPEILKEGLQKVNVKINVPDNFYSLVAEKHEKQKQEHATEKELNIELPQLPRTEQLYYKDYKLTEFDAKVLFVKDNYLVLDKTVFYPTSGGQLHDTGIINNFKVLDVIKQGKIIIHVIEENKLKINDKVHGKIDYERRLQLAQHHTSTHIVNAAARRILGKHVNQAGAKKTLEKAHIDLTHYQSLTEEELKKIEEEANKIIKQGITIKKTFMTRDEAEKKYGFTIYQGGVPIGQELRIVDIVGIDVEACGGTHLDNTKEALKIKLLKSTKISDSIIRLEFVAGKKAYEEEQKELEIIKELCLLLNCEKKYVIGRLNELFEMWKNVVKKDKKLESYELTTKEEFKGDIIAKSVEILKTQPEHLVNTIKRFIKEIKENR